MVDNASRDDSVATATALGARVCALPPNREFSAANNAALSVANGRYVAFLNPDVAVDYDGRRLLACYLDEDSEPLLLAP